MLTAFEPITGNPELCQMWGWCWNITINISFDFRLFPRKPNDKIFQKIEENRFWDHETILAFFAQIWAKVNFHGKKVLPVFKSSNYIPSCQKSGKVLCHSWGKCWTDRWMNRQMKGWRGNRDFAGPSLGQGCAFLFVEIFHFVEMQFVISLHFHSAL